MTHRRRIMRRLLFACLFLFATPLLAHSYKLGTIEIGHIWARATAPGAHAASVYVPFRNTGTETDELIGGSTPVASNFMIHESYNENGIAKMRMLKALELAPNKPVGMRPGGKHIMLTGMNRQLKEGDKFLLTLVFAKAGKIEVEVTVHAPGATSGNH